MRKLITSLAALAAVVALAGCGGDDGGGSGGTDISKADFISQANQVCAAGTAELTTAMAGVDVSTQEGIEQAIQEVLIPNIQQQIADIRAIGFPSADAATLEKLFDDAEALLGQLADDPSALTDPDASDPFEDVNDRMTEYGLGTCGESST